MPTTDDVPFEDLRNLLAKAKMRPDARAAIDLFVSSFHNGDGGQLMIQAPAGRRDLTEIAFRSESWMRLVS